MVEAERRRSVEKWFEKWLESVRGAGKKRRRLRWVVVVWCCGVVGVANESLLI